MPFNLRSQNPENKKPIIEGINGLSNVCCFDENYVSQFVFQPDELINNLTAEAKQVFADNPDLESLISTLKEMSGAFKLSKSGIAKSSSGMKALTKGNNIQHIPEGLEAYKPFIQSDKSVGLIDWQTKGVEYAELSATCPFCTSQVADKKEQINRVGQEYDKTTIKHLVNIIGVMERLGKYFSEEAKSKLSEIIHLQDGLGVEHESFLVVVKQQIDNLTGNLEELRTLSAFQFEEGEDVAEKLSQYEIDLRFFENLDSPATREAILPIKQSIDVIKSKSGELQGAVNQQRKQIKKIVKEHQDGINYFLSCAGYSYKVKIVGDGEAAQLKLRHLEHSEYLVGGRQHLSFGERNAFAIVLFMYECLSKKPDLIVLDDPISSFDKNKKYAILDMLFNRSRALCLNDKTVLMLTHDVEPIIDTVKSLYHQFGNKTSATFLELRGGAIQEFVIKKSDIQTFPSICQKALDSEKHELIKLIYLRRYYEIFEDKGDAYQVLSNLFKKRELPIDMRKPKDEEGNFHQLDSDKMAKGVDKIREWLSDFYYPRLLNEIEDSTKLRAAYNGCSNGYEKLQIFRLFGIKAEASVIQKFIDETYHIENEYICQLDPARFDTVPEYVVKACDEMLNVEPSK